LRGAFPNDRTPQDALPGVVEGRLRVGLLSFARARANGEVAPIPAVRRPPIEPRESTEAVGKRVCRWRQVKLARRGWRTGRHADPRTQTLMAWSSGPTPKIAITRFML
jgi:hypothetical protein